MVQGGAIELTPPLLYIARYLAEGVSILLPHPVPKTNVDLCLCYLVPPIMFLETSIYSILLYQPKPFLRKCLKEPTLVGYLYAIEQDLRDKFVQSTS